MSIPPRYGDAPVITIPGTPRDQLEPLSRQRQRFEEVLKDLHPDEWSLASRCTGWSIQDVAAHLDGVNRFWAASVQAGLDGSPTRILKDFDPVATPELLVAPTRGLAPRAVLDSFVASNGELLGLLGSLDDDQWATIAEAPPGHLPVRLLASHALWDSWVHERDVVVVVGRDQPCEPDEIEASLRYVSALTASLTVLTRPSTTQSVGVEALRPNVCFVLDVGERVDVRDVEPPMGLPTLRGDAVDLLDALSTRTGFPSPVPAEWAQLVEVFAAVFAGPA